MIPSRSVLRTPLVALLAAAAPAAALLVGASPALANPAGVVPAPDAPGGGLVQFEAAYEYDIDSARITRDHACPAKCSCHLVPRRHRTGRPGSRGAIREDRCLGQQCRLSDDS